MNYENYEEEPELGVDMSSSKGRLFKKDPRVNVISKEDFEERIDRVFFLLWKTLSKSFGPYGAPTLIYNYPWSHVTKDGYTIMKNLSFDASETKVDQAIADMAADICGRLNYSVGDGTTSAVIATYTIYRAYLNFKKELEDSMFILPRDVIKHYEDIKTEIVERLASKSRPIRSSDLEELRKNIYDVVYISSNGDKVITEYISDLYKELGAPSIMCTLAPDGITKKKLITGYKYGLSLNDRMYINSDEQTMNITDTDVIIFGTKVTLSTYENILKPLNEASRMRGRHLLVCAPLYDETALMQTIAPELNNEYRKTHNVNMILTTYRAISAHTRKLINDFAVLMNTTVIDRTMEASIIEDVLNGVPIGSIFNIDNRDIPGLKVIYVDENGAGYVNSKIEDDELEKMKIKNYHDVYPLRDNYIDLGYVKEGSLGLQSSHFTGLVYDEQRYQDILNDAKVDLEEKEKKYQKLGTFNIEVSQAQERLYALNLKMGIIEVGADTELSQKLLKDAVDDAVRAANSAFNHGVVQGCNLNLIQVINDMFKETDDYLKKVLLTILYEGFFNVYKTVLNNAFEDIIVESDENCLDEIMKILEGRFSKVEWDRDIIRDMVNDIEGDVSIHKVIIVYSIKINKVFDIANGVFSDAVINSLQTDNEILKATIDLISILIVGNQMLVTQKHNF